MLRWIKKPRYFIPLIVIAAIILILVIRARENSGPQIDFATVTRGDVSQEVSVTGRVRPSESVGLAFEKSGRVASIYAKVGDRVTRGETLVALENLDSRAQLLQAQANLAAEEVKLNELIAGTRPEEIKIAQTTVRTAEQSLADAKTNLENVEQKAAADLLDDYTGALAAADQSVSVAKNTILSITEIQQEHFTDSSQESIRLADAKAEAVFSLLGAQDAGRWSTVYLSELTGGAFGTVRAATENPTSDNIDKAISQTITALQKTKLMLESITIINNLTAAQKTTIETEKASINSEISIMASNSQAVSVQKTINDSAIFTAEAGVTEAQNSLTSAEDSLALKQAGNTKNQIRAQQARVDSYRAAVQEVQATLAKTVLRTPLTGIVTAQEAKLGQIVSAGSIVVSVISDAQFQIETNVPEADIKNVSLEDQANVTLDAYGDDVIFETGVISIDPAETIIEGVATYKVTLQFNVEDERVKSGMTANIDILTDSRTNVLVLPLRALIRKDGKQIVRILHGEKDIQEVPITIGLIGSDGLVEILEGVEEGDRVVVYISQ